MCWFFIVFMHMKGLIIPDRLSGGQSNSDLSSISDGGFGQVRLGAFFQKVWRFRTRRADILGGNRFIFFSGVVAYATPFFLVLSSRSVICCACRARAEHLWDAQGLAFSAAGDRTDRRDPWCQRPRRRSDRTGHSRKRRLRPSRRTPACRSNGAADMATTFDGAAGGAPRDRSQSTVAGQTAHAADPLQPSCDADSASAIGTIYTPGGVGPLSRGIIAMKSGSTRL